MPPSQKKPQPLSSSHIANAIRLLTDASTERVGKVNDTENNPLANDSDAEEDSSCPVYNRFYEESGSASIHQLTNFSVKEFNLLWTEVMDIIQQKWNRGRGRRSAYTAKDVFFMFLATAKNGGTWDFMGHIFGIKGPTFERMMTKFAETFSEPIYVKFIEGMLDKHQMIYLYRNNKTFRHYPCARYATDVTFQQSNRPSGNMQEGKKYYSGKHKLYGYKVEVSVLPIGIAVGCTDHHPGSVADIDMFYKNGFWHEEATLKSERDMRNALPDLGPLRVEYPNRWAVLADKGYQGAAENSRVIHPAKKPQNGALTLTQEADNKEIPSDRVIAENFFGRVCCLWGVCANKWRWSEELYDPFLKLCVALTNKHIMWNPLRAEDLQFYRKYKSRLYCIGESIRKKRKKVQERYREKRKKRMAMKFRDGDSDDETSSP